MSSKLKRKRKLVRMIIGNKVYELSQNMAMATVSIAKDKYTSENVNAIVGVQKGNTLAMQKDIYDTTDALEKAVKDWEHGGYTCYYVKAKGGN